MKSEPLPTLIPARPHEADEEQRLREAINRLCGQALAALDAAIKFRTAPHEAQRARHLARGHLVDFSLKAMHAITLTAAEKKQNEE